jgi:DNA-binding Lrp family transcriptional regulator
MDDVDRAIIAHLRKDGRISNVELAARVNLSPSPCLRRVRQLESSVIKGYQAVIDPHAFGCGFQVLVHANMTIKDRSTIEAFEDQVAAMDEVVECRRMFGDPDYLLWVAVQDVSVYEQFYMHKLADLPGVARMTSQFTMKVVKSGAGWG